MIRKPTVADIDEAFNWLVSDIKQKCEENEKVEKQVLKEFVVTQVQEAKQYIDGEFTPMGGLLRVDLAYLDADKADTAYFLVHKDYAKELYFGRKLVLCIGEN